jgi:hypothetical protein
MHQVASSETVLEIEHACTHCPLEPQRLAYLNGTADDCAGDLGHLDIVRPERKRTHVQPQISFSSGVELGLGITPWSPLKSGVLSGKYTRSSASRVIIGARRLSQLDDNLKSLFPRDPQRRNDCERCPLVAVGVRPREDRQTVLGRAMCASRQTTAVQQCNDRARYEGTIARDRPRLLSLRAITHCAR